MLQIRRFSMMLSFAVVGSGMILTSAGTAAKPAAAAQPHRFNVNGAVFAGLPKTICVIEGKWKDGEYFRFEAWDECSQMRMRRVTAAEYQNARSHGIDTEHTVADVPPGAEVLEVSNDYSSVLLFRDKRGLMREILYRD